MNNFIKSNPEEEAKYEGYLDIIFNNDFYDNQENILNIANELVSLKDYKGLVFLLHTFYDTILVEEYIKKGINTKHLFNSYVYFVSLIDKSLKLPESYYKNEIKLIDDKNIYFNYYVALRTLIDHSIIPYEDGNFISREVDSWATELKFDDVCNKPTFFDEVSIEEFINGALGAYNKKYNKDYSTLVYSLLSEYIHLKDIDKDRFNYLKRMNDYILDFNEEEFLKLAQNTLDHDDIKTVIFSLLDFAKLANKYPNSYSKIRAFYHFTRVYNDFRNKQKIRLQNFNPYPLKIDVSDIPSLIGAYNVICSAFIGYLESCFNMNEETIKDHYSNIKELLINTIKVNKYYTDLLGKSFDNFYYSFLELYFNPGDDIIDFGIFYTSQECDPLNLIWMDLVFYNNVTSQDYPDQLYPLLEKSMNDIYQVESINYRVIMKYQLIEASNIQHNLYNDFVDAYNELYGERENPMNSANFIS